MPTRYTDTVSRMIYLNMLRRNCLQSFARQNGISFEYVPTLEHIKRFPGCMQTDISKKLKVSAAAVTQSTQKLEGAGLIEKRVDPQNLRVKRMYITDKGSNFLNNGVKCFDMVDGIMFDGFSDTELHSFNDMLDRISRNMADYKNNLDEKRLPWEFTKNK